MGNNDTKDTFEGKKDGFWPWQTDATDECRNKAWDEAGKMTQSGTFKIQYIDELTRMANDGNARASDLLKVLKLKK